MCVFSCICQFSSSFYHRSFRNASFPQAHLTLASSHSTPTLHLWPLNFLPRGTNRNSCVVSLFPIPCPSAKQKRVNKQMISYCRSSYIHEVCYVCPCVSMLKVEFNLWYCYQFHGAGGLFGRPTAALTYLCQCTGLHVDCFSFSVCCMCVCVHSRSGRCVFEASSLWTWGVWEAGCFDSFRTVPVQCWGRGCAGLLEIWASCRGENRVSGGVDMTGWDEGKGFIPSHQNDTRYPLLNVKIYYAGFSFKKQCKDSSQSSHDPLEMCGGIFFLQRLYPVPVFLKCSSHLLCVGCLWVCNPTVFRWGQGCIYR